MKYTSEQLEAKIRTDNKIIRTELDREVNGQVVDEVIDKVINLTQLEGLSAENMGAAKKVLRQKELIVLIEMKSKDYTASYKSSLLKAECNEEEALFQYTDRLNAALHHTLDALRSVISIRKEEMKASLGA